MADTRKLWEMFKQGKYDVYLSAVTIWEIQNCKEPKRRALLDYLEQIQYVMFDISDETLDVAEQLLSNNTEGFHIPDFTIDDIHKIREYHYEITKDMV